MRREPDPRSRASRYRSRHALQQAQEVPLEEAGEGDLGGLAMSILHLLPVGTVDGSLLVDLRRGLANAFNVRCEIIRPPLDPEFAFHPERMQYHSTELLERLSSEVAS